MESLIFIPGWVNKYLIEKGDILDFYQGAINELKKDLRVFFVYSPGFDGKEFERAYNLDDYVNFLKSYFEKNSLENAIILGHSFGGQVAVKFSYLYPQMVKKLILYNPACIRKQNWKQKFFTLISKPGRLIFWFFPGLRKIFYKVFIGSTAYLKLPPLAQQTFQAVIKEDLTPILKEIKVPTLILWGEKDKLTPLWQGKMINKLIKDSKLIIHPQGTHSFHQDNPVEFANYVKNFIFGKI